MLDRDDAGIQWAVRYHSPYGSHINFCVDEAQARKAAGHHATLPGCWAQVLTRTIPPWIVADTAPTLQPDGDS